MLATYLIEERQAIIDGWFALIARTYPSDTAAFFRRESDQFANPVGTTIKREMECIFDLLLESDDSEEIAASLDNINKIRAVQDFDAAHAVAYIFYLKQVVREAVVHHITDIKLFSELLAFESRIDGVALLAFDNYMECREKLHQLRFADMKRRAGVAVDRINQRATENK